MLLLAQRLVGSTTVKGARLIVNDRVDVARLAGAAGVHLGQDDLPASAARGLLPDKAVIGLSTHSAAQVRQARQQPIDYLAIGPVFSTQTKRPPDPEVGLAGVREAAGLAAVYQLPVVAIGGITLETAPAVIEAGATSVAVISDLLVGDPAARARDYLSTLG